MIDLETIIKQFIHIVSLSSNQNRSIAKEIRETTQIVSPEFIKFLVDHNMVGVLEEAQGLFAPGMYFTKIEVPEELYKFLNEAEGDKFKTYSNIRYVLSSKFMSLNTPLEYITKYPKAFWFNKIPLTKEIFLEIVKASPEISFSFRNFTNKLINEFLKKKPDEKFLKEVAARTSFANSEGLPSFELQSRMMSTDNLQIFQNNLNNALLSPLNVTLVTYRNMLLELINEDSETRKFFNENKDKISNMFSSERVSEFVQENIEQFIKDYLTPFNAYDRNGRYDVDFGPLFWLYEKANKNANYKSFSSLVTMLDNYLKFGASSILLLCEIFSTSKEFIGPVLRCLNFVGLDCIIDLLTKSSDNTIRKKISESKFQDKYNEFIKYAFEFLSDKEDTEEYQNAREFLLTDTIKRRL